MDMWKVNLSGSLVLACGVLFGVDLESPHLDALKVRPQGLYSKRTHSIVREHIL